MSERLAIRSRHSVKIKRVYDRPEPSDGFRILIDRMWPRGMSKARAAVDLWDREIAPSNELRKWFGHDPAKWAGFRRRYRHELATRTDLVSDIRSKLADRNVTLLYAAADERHNNARCLLEYLTERTMKGH